MANLRIIFFNYGTTTITCPTVFTNAVKADFLHCDPQQLVTNNGVHVSYFDAGTPSLAIPPGVYGLLLDDQEFTITNVNPRALLIYAVGGKDPWPPPPYVVNGQSIQRAVPAPDGYDPQSFPQRIYNFNRGGGEEGGDPIAVTCAFQAL